MLNSVHGWLAGPEPETFGYPSPCAHKYRMCDAAYCLACCQRMNTENAIWIDSLVAWLHVDCWRLVEVFHDGE